MTNGEAKEDWVNTQTSLKLLFPNVAEGAVKYSEDLHHMKTVISGGTAGCVAKTFVAPLTRVTILMQVQSMRPHKFVKPATPNNQYLWQSLLKILQEEGLTGLFRGNGAMVVHRFPYTAITFQGHAISKQKLEQFPFLPDQLRTLVGAGCSACAACVICYPLDVVKTRLTTQTKSRYYTGIFDCIIKIRRDEGWRAWYRGLGVSICSVVPSIALNFHFYEQFYWLYKGLAERPYAHSFLAGGSSGALASLLLFPMDLLRRQLQMVGVGGRKPIYSGVADAAKKVFRTGAARGKLLPFRIFWGMREFFRGFVPELIKVTPNNAIMFSVNNQLMQAKWYFEP